MTLELASGRVIEHPTEADIRSGIEAEEFAILGSGPATYIQCKRISPECDGYWLEYQEGSLDAHYEVVDIPVLGSQVAAAFLKYVQSDNSWRSDFKWEKMDNPLGA
ncbi:MAG TPA: hypothetical protein VJ783_03045 [Pirellulales bacterium]|nr:hypothetical protein [Pirellulales bacterium]